MFTCLYIDNSVIHLIWVNDMKFEDLKNNLKKQIDSSYLLIGSDEFLLSSAYNLILKYGEIDIPDLNVIRFNEGNINCEDVVRALETMPVFSKRKLVHLDIRMTKKSEIKNLNMLIDYLSHPNADAVLVVSLGDNEDISIDSDGMTIVDCSKLDFKIVSAKINATIKKYQKTIDDRAVQMLFDYTLGDLSKILIECDKLVAYVGDRNEITSDDVVAIVNKTLEYQVYELTENLAKKNSARVYEILEDMSAKKDEYKTLPALIYAHFRRLFMIALNPGLNNYELSKNLGVKEFAVKMSRPQAEKFSKSSLKKINELCTKVDFDIKQSNISVENAVNLVVLSILNM